MIARHRLILAAALATVHQSGCQGCREEPKAKAEASEAPTLRAAVDLPTPSTAIAEPAAATPQYAGPSSKAADGYQLSTGFLTPTGQPLPQPKSGEQTAIYTTALDPVGHPIGALDRIGAAEMVGFLVARDLRHALMATANAPVREGADARALTFAPPAGGDHALVALFRPHVEGAEPGAIHAVISPVSVSGNLPQLLGPGLSGLDLRAQSGQEHLQLVAVPAEQTPSASLTLQLFDVDGQGHRKGAVHVPFAVLVDPPMGRAIVLEAQEGGELHWSSPVRGEWLVLVAPKRGDRALAFHLTVPAAPEKK